MTAEGDRCGEEGELYWGNMCVWVDVGIYFVVRVWLGKKGEIWKKGLQLLEARAFSVFRDLGLDLGPGGKATPSKRKLDEAKGMGLRDIDNSPPPGQI